MIQDQILEKLKVLNTRRGCLSALCREAGIDYQRVWRFTNGKVKKLNLDDGKQLSRALKSAPVKAMLSACGEANG